MGFLVNQLIPGRGGQIHMVCGFIIRPEGPDAVVVGDGHQRQFFLQKPLHDVFRDNLCVGKNFILDLFDFFYIFRRSVIFRIFPFIRVEIVLIASPRILGSGCMKMQIRLEKFCSKSQIPSGVEPF